MNNREGGIKMGHKRIALSSILVLFTLSLFVTASARANLASVAVAPVTKSISLSTGESQSGDYVVYNNTDEPQHVTVRPRYWKMADANKDIPMDSWLKITPTEFDLGPNEKKAISFTATAPKGAVGELVAMIAFKPTPKEGQTINIVFSVSLYMRIKDNEKIADKLSIFDVYNLTDRKSALGIRVQIENDGNVHLKPRITVFIRDLFNKTLQKADFKYGKPTYPGAKQDYYGSIYNFSLRPGVYKAYIAADYTNVPRRLRRTVYFVVGREGKILFTLFKGSK